MLHLETIPEDVLIHIASHLELDDLWRLRQVSTRVRVVTSTDQVWRMASSYLGALLPGPGSATDAWTASNSSAFPDPLIRDIWRAARIDRRWSSARPCGGVGYAAPDGVTWSYVRLAGGEWVLCTDERGEVMATHLAQAISPSPQRPKHGMVYESEFDPYCAWASLVDWFRSPAILIVQLRSSYRSLFVRCFALPSLGLLAPSTPEKLFQYNLSLGAVSVAAIQVDVALRCLMVLCRDPNHGSREVHLELWRWRLDEEHSRLPPQCAMRTVPFKTADCEFCLVETEEGPHVFVVRASEETTHLEFYDLPEPEVVPVRAGIEPEPRMPVASASLPWVCHQITLPQPGARVAVVAGTGYSISVLLCAARSAKRSELMAYRVSLHRRNVRLSFLGGQMLPEYHDVLDCVLGERGVRGVASIAGPRTGTPVELALLTCRDDHFKVQVLKEPAFEAHRPMRLAFDEIRGTIVFLDDEGNIHVVPFDSELFATDCIPIR